MTDEESPDMHSRRKRLATHRRRVRVIGAAVVVLVVLATGTFAMLHGRDQSSAATPGRHASARLDPAPDSTIAAPRNVGPPRVVTHADPMRLWIGGDSLAGSFGPALGQTAGATGVVDATIDYKVSSGLEDQGIRDWYEHAQEKMASIDPDVVVFIIGTNDASIVNTYDSNGDGVADWKVDYRKKVDRMMETFVGGSRHRTVYWLGPPTLGDHSLNKGGYELGRVMKSEATKFGGNVVYVDAYHLFSDSNGRYSRSLPDATGKVREMRISDGIHFSVDGAKYLAAKLWTAIDKRWQVSAHADPSEPIDYTIAEGSNDYVPGVGRYRPTVPSSSSSNDTTSSEATSTTLSTATTGVTTTLGVSTTTKPVVTTTQPAETTTSPPSTAPKKNATPIP